VLGISIIIPAFPELRAYYGVGNFAIIMWLTIYSLCSFLAAPILWQRSDRIGRKTSLVRCIAGTAASYFFLLIQPWYWIFLIARVINGITGWNISIIQAILTDISPDQATKNKNFWLMWAIFWLGFIIGPLAWSLLLSIGGVEMIFIGGWILATLQFIMLAWWFTNTNIHQNNKKIHYNPLTVLQKYIQRPQLRPWLLSFISLGFGWFIINSSQSLYMADMFGTSGIMYGYYMAWIWVIAALNMALFVPHFWTKYFSTTTIIKISFSSLVVGYLLLWFIASELSYLLTFFLTVLLSWAYGVLYNVHIMSQAAPGEVWEMSWMFGSIQSLAMIFGPLFGWLLLESTLNMHRGSLFFVVIAIVLMWDELQKTD
jgi:DHA1 family tetracycline resistance protein-like MFS transporter